MQDWSQILVIKLPEYLESCSSGASYFAVSISDEASIDAAGTPLPFSALLLYSELLLECALHTLLEASRNARIAQAYRLV